MIRAIVIDDEQHCVDRISGLLNSQYADTVHVMDVATSVEEGLALIKKLRPDLVFLDVQLHDQTGFDLLQQAGKVDFEVIFTTAFDRYAVQAFRFSALDYLLKPVDEDDLREAMQKYLSKNTQTDISGRLDALFYNIKGPSKRIGVPVVNGIVFLQVADIVRCESEINYTTLFLKDKQKLLVAKTLKEFEELLTEYNFFRVHNSHLINLAYIKSYNKGKGGSVSLTDNTVIEVSTRRKEEFLKKLAEL